MKNWLIVLSLVAAVFAATALVAHLTREAPRAANASGTAVVPLVADFDPLVALRSSANCTQGQVSSAYQDATGYHESAITSFGC